MLRSALMAITFDLDIRMTIIIYQLKAHNNIINVVTRAYPVEDFLGLRKGYFDTILAILAIFIFCFLPYFS